MDPDRYHFHHWQPVSERWEIDGLELTNDVGDRGVILSTVLCTLMYCSGCDALIAAVTVTDNPNLN